jgi:leader peptidase (prepilin peptidase) / N-methyltransferase
MIEMLLVIVCIAASALLVVLTYIDLRDRLLPNIYVLPLALLGIAFHALTDFRFCTPQAMALGALAGAGTLLFIRTAANAYYKKDTLGLGDVKLMGAAGLWLGLDHIFLGLAIGAGLGVIHGLAYAFVKKEKSLSTLAIPAGPGFIGGIVMVFLLKIFWT